MGLRPIDLSLPRGGGQERCEIARTKHGLRVVSAAVPGGLARSSSALRWMMPSLWFCIN
jgi:hypothetical protein